MDHAQEVGLWNEIAGVEVELKEEIATLKAQVAYLRQPRSFFWWLVPTLMVVTFVSYRLGATSQSERINALEWADCTTQRI